jgi:hypothetical protein
MSFRSIYDIINDLLNTLPYLLVTSTAMLATGSIEETHMVTDECILALPLSPAISPLLIPEDGAS